MIYLGSDHGGFDLKEKIKKWLIAMEYAWEDMGNTVYDKDDDYPAYAFLVAEKIAIEEKNGKVYPIPWRERPKGILCCRSGVGMVMAANRVKGIRAIAPFNTRIAVQSRLHNDTNILALGSNWLETYQVKKIISAWLTTEFSGEERHLRRLKMIEEYGR